jgi:hypothetical protein
MPDEILTRKFEFIGSDHAVMDIEAELHGLWGEIIRVKVKNLTIRMGLIVIEKIQERYLDERYYSKNSVTLDGFAMAFQHERQACEQHYRYTKIATTGAAH